MALFINFSNKFIEISLDGTTDFDSETDLQTYGISKNAPDGLSIKKITFIPSSVNDTVIVRDGQNGPRVFSAVDLLGTWDVLKDEYEENGKIDKGKIMNPYIHANESTIGIVNQAYLILEL